MLMKMKKILIPIALIANLCLWIYVYHKVTNVSKIVFKAENQMYYDTTFPNLITKKDTKVLNISIIELISNPERYDGKFVLVEGFVTEDNDGWILYESTESMNCGFNKNGIKLSFNKSFYSKNEDEIKKIHNGNSVLVLGTFKAKIGKEDVYSGTLENIIRYDKNDILRK